MITAAWPKTPIADDVATFVDFTNILMSEDDLYQGDFSARKIVTSIHTLAKELGRHVHMAIYVETDVLKIHNATGYMELGLTAHALGAKVIHVPTKNRLDNVDAVMIEDMLELNSFPDHTLPFLVVTADKHFVPAITEIKKTRPVFSGLPTQNMLPSISRSATSWHWIDRLSWRHMAVYNALCPDQCPEISYIRFSKSKFPDFLKAWKMLEEILAALDPLPPCYSPSEVVKLLQTRLSHLDFLTEASWWYYFRALEYYEVIGRNFDDPFGIHFQVDFSHPAFERIRYLKAC